MAQKPNPFLQNPFAVQGFNQNPVSPTTSYLQNPFTQWEIRRNQSKQIVDPIYRNKPQVEPTIWQQIGSTLEAAGKNPVVQWTAAFGQWVAKGGIGLVNEVAQAWSTIVWAKWLANNFAAANKNLQNANIPGLQNTAANNVAEWVGKATGETAVTVWALSAMPTLPWVWAGVGIPKKLWLVEKAAAQTGKWVAQATKAKGAYDKYRAEVDALKKDYVSGEYVVYDWSRWDPGMHALHIAQKYWKNMGWVKKTANSIADEVNKNLARQQAKNELLDATFSPRQAEIEAKKLWFWRFSPLYGSLKKAYWNESGTLEQIAKNEDKFWRSNDPRIKNIDWTVSWSSEYVPIKPLSIYD